MPQYVPIEQFGKDHWSTFAYAECCVVDRQFLDKRRLRCNPETHPLNAVNQNHGVCMHWDPKYGTRLKGFFEDPSQQLESHDDWDCLDDLDHAGLLEVISVANAHVELMEKGMQIASELRIFKQKGGNFASFTPSVCGECPQSEAKVPLDSFVP